MTLRDDVIFLGFVYQWYIYPADKARANEFGFQYENKDQSKAILVGDMNSNVNINTDEQQRDESRILNDSHKDRFGEYQVNAAESEIVCNKDMSQAKLKMLELDVAMSLNKVFFNGSQFGSVKELFIAAVSSGKYVHVNADNRDQQSKSSFDQEFVEKIVDN